MIILIAAFIASQIPSLGIYFWLRKRNTDPIYQQNCRQALIKGFLCFFPVILCSMIFALIGFVMGYFYGKFLKTGKKEYAVLGFLVPWLMHGTYDFTLTDEISDLADWLPIIPVGLAFFSLVLIIWFIIFVKKAEKKELYTEDISVPVRRAAGSFRHDGDYPFFMP